MNKLIERLKALKPTEVFELDDDAGFVLITDDLEPVLWTPDRELADAALEAAKE